MRFLKGSSPLPGPTKLLACIRASGLSVPRFCELRGLPRHTVEKAIKGKLQMTVAFATDIEKATDGAVVVADWAFESEAATGTED